MIARFGAEDEAITGGAPARSLTFDPITVEGDKPPSLLRTLAPWLVGGIVIAGLWYFAASTRRRARADRPFVG